MKMRSKEETREEEKEKEKEKKKRKIKNTKEQEHISFPDHFVVVSADLSLRRPGFCIVEIFDNTIHRVETSFVDNKMTHKPHGEILNEIYQALPFTYDSFMPVYYVREKGFIVKGAEAQMSKFKVVGVMDMALWRYDKLTWHEIYPVTVKKLVTGNASADKQQVADALKQYLGDRTYSVDDESDAAAVAVAFLLQNGFVFPKESDTNEQPEERN